MWQPPAGRCRACKLESITGAAASCPSPSGTPILSPRKMQTWTELGGENQPLEDIFVFCRLRGICCILVFWNAANIGYLSLQMRVSHPLAWALARAEAAPRLSGFQIKLARFHLQTCEGTAYSSYRHRRLSWLLHRLWENGAQSKSEERSVHFKHPT